MRFGIVGTGALGGVYGGLLHANGEDVHCYEADGAIVDAIDEEGLRIERPDDEALVVDLPVTTDPAEVDPVDVAFVFTKSFDTEQAMRDAAPMIDGRTRVATVQNGVLNVEIIAEHVPRERVLGGYTRAGANTLAPGHVEFMGMSGSGSHLGGEDYETAREVARRLTGAGLGTEAVEDPLPYIWKKQLRNVARKPLSALTELRNGPQSELPETRAVARGLIEEAMAVARAKDIEVLDDDPVASFLQPVAPEKYEKKSSILEDVENERRTEIEQITGAVVQYGEEEGIDTPYNRMATNLVLAKEQSYLD
ncbi:MAG: ketopantoate reductase family protein [Haloferacaceae archaeon]